MNHKLLISVCALLLASVACNMGAGQNVPTTNPLEGATPGLPTTSSPMPPIVSTDGCSNPLFPVKLGASWNYILTGAVSDTYTTTIIAADSSGFTEQNIFTTGTTRIGAWTCENGNLLSLNQGGNSASVTASDVTSEFQTIAKSGYTIPASINPGDTWIQTLTIEGKQTISGTEMTSKNEMSADCNAVGNESVTVPAGTFDTMRVDCVVAMTITVDMNGNIIPTSLNMNSSTWYATNVGMVKSSSTGSDINTVIELQSYSIP